MTSLERYRNIVQNKPVDFLPRLPILMRYAAEYIGSNYGAFASDYRVLVEANLRCCADFGIDQLNTMSDPYRETQGFGAAIEFVRDGVPRCPHPPMETHKNLDALPRPDPMAAERMRDRIDAVRAYKSRMEDAHSIMGWVEGPAAEAADVRGVSAFLIDLIDDPPFVEALMARCVDTAIDFAQPQIDAGADTIGIGDAIASQVSPQIYERLILPQEKRLVSALKKMGATVRLHICGNITHLLPGIATLGVDIIDIDHPVNMKTARKILGENTVLTGNIDPVSAVLNGAPKTIRKTIMNTYRDVGNPYMVNAGCEIPSGTPIEHLKALCEPIPYEA